MGLDITINEGTVHPKFLDTMLKGDCIGCGDMFEGEYIVQVTGEVYYQRKMYRVRDALCKGLNDKSESEYHLITPERAIAIRDVAKRFADMLIGNPSDTYYDELGPLRELSAVMDTIANDTSGSRYFAIWG